jgi:pimeloyl-ACP methyl ester carboxylesterase
MADFTDIVVLIPGITGSVLERNGREVWGASAAAVLHGLMSGGRSIQDLILENDDPAVDDLGDGVSATRLVEDVHLFPGLWTIDGYTKVAQRLCQRLKLEPGVSYFTLPYDWRRDNRVAARKLQRESAGWLAARRRKFPDARMVLVAHSMGGLVSRYFLEVLGGWRDVRTLVSFGTPYRGSLNAVDTIINGARKLNILDLTDLSRSFTAIYQLLPTYRCFDNGDGALVKLSDVTDLPRLDRSHIDRIRAADAFHREIEKAVTANQAEAGANVVRYAIRPVVGMEQPTHQTAVRAAGGVTLVRARNGDDEGGDGTVPRVSATPFEAGEAQATFAAARHGSLQNTDAVLSHVQGVLTTPRDLGQLRAAGAPTTLSLDVDDIFAANEPIRFAVRPSDDGVALDAIIEHVDQPAVRQVVHLRAAGAEWRHRELPPLPPGVYRITVQGDPAIVEPVSDVFGVA